MGVKLEALFTCRCWRVGLRLTWLECNYKVNLGRSTIDINTFASGMHTWSDNFYQISINNVGKNILRVRSNVGTTYCYSIPC